MPHDNRINIRLTPRQLRALRAVVSAFADSPRIAAMLGLGSEEITIAKDSLMQLPVLIPDAATDNQQPATNNR